MRPTHALIDLDALRHNYRLARELGGGRALAVVKADAYGHGAVRCAAALEAEADGFAVACIEEALALREAGIGKPILLLEGFFEAGELPLIAEHGLWTVIHAPWQIEMLERAALAHPVETWLKLDSGMHRVGIDADAYAGAWKRLRTLPQVAGIVKMSHFARADEPGCPRTLEQLETFARITAGLPGPSSLCNSPALLGWPQAKADWARPGLMLYGASPFPQPHEAVARLRPVMTLESRVIAVRELPAGEPVGYGARFVTEGPTRVGVVAVGYADGYPQFAVNGTPVAIDGRPGRLIGRVSMDMLTVDLTDHPQAGVGSRVELWGAQVPAAQVVAHSQTSAYRLLCAVKRVPLRYCG
ncbi:alanine racemase [Pseudoxanthomonas broegbernensis]|uniref:Alanine racemase n=1 Tax=Pseudoxanthomonas broegbernensis TaxID=83619 RepID=A0A7V8K5V1_9GAMM|nr:alanine racemase [Pseudoxanthomonas broegbernensis]KAF1684910.1 alanine racemase [Pseudoxanthomonas broegbernensis]MBB6066280.1 alanine racemase [Pseudoxanthomonas broegbernensis]